MGAALSSLLNCRSEDTSDSPQREKLVSEEIISPTECSVLEVGFEDIDLQVPEESTEVAKYCLLLIGLHFCGQTCKSDEKDTDKAEVTDVLNLGVCLSLLDKYLKQFDKVTDFTGEEEDYELLLMLIARKRRRVDSKETVDNCHKRLLKQSKRFVQIYHKRGVKSEILEHDSYWGSRQQLLSGKVIGDWVDKENGPLDAVFGAILQPTAGRVGPGDTGWIHDLLFDDDRHMAYHSAVHDAFGYLMTNHELGPGYDYLHGSTFFQTDNPLAGQTPGISFWRRTIKDIETKHKVLKAWRCE